MSFAKPFSQACENNKLPILEVLQSHFSVSGKVLEVGSGTGQHAVYFAGRLPHLEWQPSDVAENLPGIRAWCDSVVLGNLKCPLELDVFQADWGDFSGLDYIFSANTMHIMSWAGVEAFFGGIERYLKPGGMLALYGPFNYAGRYTSESNAAFDQWLRTRDPLSGIRDFEDLEGLAMQAGLSLIHDYAMPANNRALLWERTAVPVAV